MLIRMILEDMIHLLKGSALRFRNEEVRPHPGENTENGKEDVCAVAGVFDQRWGDQTLGSVRLWAHSGGANAR